MRSAAAGTLATSPTLRFEYTADDTGRPARLWLGLPTGKEQIADGIGGAALTIPNAPVGSYQPSLILFVADIPYWTFIPVTLKIFVDSALARTDHGYIRTSGYDVYAYWMPPPYYHLPVRIKITLASSELAPLGDSDNKPNPNPSDTTRKYVIDRSKAKSTPMSVFVTDLDGNPMRAYRLTFRAYGKDTTGGHDHGVGMRPGGRFVTARQETTYMLQARTDSAGKVQCTYLCSGFGGVDSIYVRGTSPIDTVTALVTLKVKGLEELKPGDHYKLVGAFGEPGVNSQHRVNHYGTATLLSKLTALADSVYASKEYILRINDMSLIYGGPFDIKNNWDTPHQNHREGASADVDNEVETQGGRKAITKKQLAEWLEMVHEKEKFSVGDEGNHFHITVR